MRLKLPFLILAIFFSTILSALPVIINGHSAAGDAFDFRLSIEKDGFSGLKEILDQQRPNSDGDFSLGFEAREIQEVNIEVGLQSFSFYVIPGKTYHLNFKDITLEDQNVFLPQNPIRVVFEEEDMLNLVIDGFEYEYQKFLGEKFMILIKNHDKKLYSDFATNMQVKLKESPIHDSLSKNFVSSYIRYKMAELRLISKIQDREELGLQELTNQKTLLKNTSYISFVKKYFTNYFQDANNGKDYYKLRNLVKQSPPVNKMMDALGQNPVLIDEKLRELVFILSLKQVFFRSDFSQENINDILEHLALKSKFANNREIARNIKFSLNRFSTGLSVPEISLNDINGHLKTLNSYKGKKVYLMFVSPSCETCEADFRVLKALKNQIGEDINLVSVFVGFNKEDAFSWVKSQNVDWDFLWFDNNFNLLNEFQVKTFPKYLLLDEESKLLRYFPPKPRENLTSYLQGMKKKEESNKEDNREGAIDIFRKN